MKKRFISIIFLFLIIINLNLVYSQSKGVNVCNINKECGIADGICPENFFPPGTTCYIEDPDCCKINKAIWSSDNQGLKEINSVIEGGSVFMFIDTFNCIGKDAKFDIYRVKDNLVFSDEEELVTPSPFATKKIIVNKVALEIKPELGANLDFSKFKFKVKINPESESSLLDVETDGSSSSTQTNTCTDGIDNDADGCSDELADCGPDGPGIEDPDLTNDPTKCPGGTTPACSGWKCVMGECVDGFKSLQCPPVPEGCPLTRPSTNTIKCYEDSVPFPFFTNFNFGLVLFLLTGYYGFRIYKRK